MSTPVSTLAAKRPRVILAKPGLDGHDRGVKVVAMALRDAGAEVLYLGLQQSPGQIVGAALAEDVDIIGLSVLSGVHMAVAEQVMRACQAADLDDVSVVVGGTIPAPDVARLKSLGVRDVFPAGTPLRDVVDRIFEIVRAGREPS